MPFILVKLLTTSLVLYIFYGAIIIIFYFKYLFELNLIFIGCQFSYIPGFIEIKSLSLSIHDLNQLLGFNYFFVIYGFHGVV